MPSDQQGGSVDHQRRSELLDENKKVEGEMLSEVRKLKEATNDARKRLILDEYRLRRRT